MRRYRTHLVLALIVVAAAAAAYLSQREDPGIANSGEKFLPDFLDRMGEVTEIANTHGGETVTLALADGRWTVVEHFGYPAENSEVRELLVGAAELVRVEPKTDRPEQYEKLELEDPAHEDAKSIGYVLQDDAGRTIVDLVVGKRRFVQAAAREDEYFVREVGRPRAWLVAGKIPRNRRAIDWLRREVTKLDQVRVRRSAVLHPDGTVVRASKSSTSDTEFTLAGVPEGHEIDKTFVVHSIGTALATLTLQDVAPLDEVDFTGDQLEVVMETFDGLRLNMRTGSIGERTLIRLEAEFDPALAQPNPEAPLLDEAAARAEVEALTARWEGWAYEIAKYTLENLRKKVDEIVKPIESDSDPLPSSG